MRTKNSQRTKTYTHTAVFFALHQLCSFVHYLTDLPLFSSYTWKKALAQIDIHDQARKRGRCRQWKQKMDFVGKLFWMLSFFSLSLSWLFCLTCVCVCFEVIFYGLKKMWPHSCVNIYVRNIYQILSAIQAVVADCVVRFFSHSFLLYWSDYSRWQSICAAQTINRKAESTIFHTLLLSQVKTTNPHSICECCANWERMILSPAKATGIIRKIFSF